MGGEGGVGREGGVGGVKRKQMLLGEDMWRLWGLVWGHKSRIGDILGRYN